MLSEYVWVTVECVCYESDCAFGVCYLVVMWEISDFFRIVGVVFWWDNDVVGN